ncbi:MAG TPA: hypothetical protein VN231_08030, partial [Allosphingosinicella sp.]|nr:hypothetical protein [Allosphingosinicella sp.]
MRLRSCVLLASAVLLAGCVSSAETSQPATLPPPRAYTIVGLENVIGSTARALIAQFGRPDLELREGNARKLQFLAPACVLDAYLYPPRG